METLLHQQTLSSSCRILPYTQSSKSNHSLHVNSKHKRSSTSFVAVLADDFSREQVSVARPSKLSSSERNGTLQPGSSAPADSYSFHGETDDGASASLAPSASSPSTSTASRSPSSPTYRLVELPHQLRSVKDYMDRAPELITSTSGSPRWFCPLECGKPPQDVPVLLFLPGMDGTGLGLIRHYENLGRMFEVRCLHIPVSDRTPVEGLIELLEEVVREEFSKSPSKPIYLVGDSLGGALALAVAARNPKVDLVLVLANPSTSFINSGLQPIFPLLEALPDQIYHAVPFLLSFIMGNPIRLALASVDKRLPDLNKSWAVRENLVALLPTLPTLVDIIPKETLVWKLKLLKSMAMYANSRLHAVKAEVLVLASGKDQMLPSRDEALRLQKILSNCVVRYYKDSGHTLLLEDGMDLGTVIRGAQLYRKSKKFHSVADFVYPTSMEFEEAYGRTKFVRQLTSPQFFSTTKTGIVQGLSGVPEGDPILLVGNHMLMGMEIIPLITEFMKRKQLIRGVGHPVIFSKTFEKGLTEPGFNDDARVFGSFMAGKKNFYNVLSNKECTLLYPGGAREALHRKGEAYKLFWPEQSEFVRAAARFGVTIVPFGVVGEDDVLEMVLDYNDIQKIPFLPQIFDDYNSEDLRVRRWQSDERGNQNLHMPLLIPKAPGRLYFLFGKPFRTAGREQELQSKAAADGVYKEMKKEVENCLQYLLGKREEDPYRAFLPRFIEESLRGGEWQAPTFKP